MAAVDTGTDDVPVAVVGTRMVRTQMPEERTTFSMSCKGVYHT